MSSLDISKATAIQAVRIIKENLTGETPMERALSSLSTEFLSIAEADNNDRKEEGKEQFLKLFYDVVPKMLIIMANSKEGDKTEK